MKNPTSLIDYVYETYIEQFLSNLESDTEDAEPFFKLIYMESTIPLPGQPLHNQHINYYKQQRSYEIEPLYRPSKLYMFSFLKEGVLCSVIDRSNRESTAEIPECTIMINEPCSYAVSESLLVTCQRICQHQTAANLFLKGLKCEDFGETDLFKLSENTQAIRVISCKLSLEIMSKLMQQFYKCKYLTRLDLSGTSLAEGGYHLVQAIKSLADSPPLLEVNLSNCSVPGDVCDKLMEFLSTCNHLTNLNLSNNTLTGHLFSFVQDSYPGLLELEILNLDTTVLSKTDLQHLFNVFKSNKLPKLEYLDLSNNILAGFISNLLLSTDLPQLEKLSVQQTALSKEDLQMLFSNTHKLPKLRYLDLSHNILTGCLSKFQPQAKLTSLEELIFEHTSLSNEDIHNLSYLIGKQKLPNITWLDLDNNGLCEIKKELKKLIKTCIAHHQRELKIELKFNNLSESFLEKCQRRCHGTRIYLSI